MITKTDNELELQGDQRQPAMPEQDGLEITTEEALSVFKRIIDTEGLQKAQLVHKSLCRILEGLEGWSEMSQAIIELLERESERLSHSESAPTVDNFGTDNEIQIGDINNTNQGEG